MEWNLAPEELRVLGALMEKEATTPEQYPLSVNALVNACNQKSSRDPQMSLAEGDVRATLGRLTQRGLVHMAGGYGGRVSRYEHRLGSGPTAALDREQRALLCVLFLRGAQTPGELRSRSQRLADFPAVDAVEATLSRMAQAADGALVERLAREPGKREARYRHRLGAATDHAFEPSPAAPLTAPEPAASMEARISALEREVAALRRMIENRSEVAAQ